MLFKIICLGLSVALSVESFEVITDDVHVSYNGTINAICNDEENRFQMFTSTQLPDCVIECALREHCLVINYKLGMNLCELYHLDELSSNASGNCFRLEKKDIVLAKSPCKKSPCSPGTVCDRNIKTCTTKECLAAPNITNGKVMGNLRRVGSRIQYVCNNGFRLTNISNNVAECRDSGSWSIEGSCVANVKLNEECPSEDSCMNENAACLPHGAVNICQCADGYVDDNGNENGGICIPKLTIGELCYTTHSQCAHPSVRCVHKTSDEYYCHCQFGYEFNKTLGICVKVCSAYSNDSSEFKGERDVGVEKYNIGASPYAVSADGCIKYCTENEPLYLSIDTYVDGNCYCNAISKQQFITVHGRLQSDNYWTFYDRPCAITV